MPTDFTVTVGTSSDFAGLDDVDVAVATDLEASTTKVFSHSGETGTVADGASVTGSSSGATATVLTVTGTQVLVESISGTFTSGENMEVDASNYVTLSDAGDYANVVMELKNELHVSSTVTFGTDWECGGANSTYIEIKPASGGEVNGVRDSGARLKSTYNADVIRIQNGAGKDWRLEQFAIVAVANFVKGINYEAFTIGPTGYIRGVMMYDDGTNRSWYRAFQAGDISCPVSGCVVIGPSTGSEGSAFVNPYASNYAFYNCLAVDMTVGFNENAGVDGYIVNCLTYGCTTDYNVGTHADTNGHNNASSQATTTTPVGNNPITTNIVSGDFVNTSTSDYHMAASGSTLAEAGYDHGPVTNTRDIDGDTFVYFGVGADDGVAAGGGGGGPTPRLALMGVGI